MADFLCTSCGKTFSRKAALQKHFSDVHKQENCECKDVEKGPWSISTAKGPDFHQPETSL